METSEVTEWQCDNGPQRRLSVACHLFGIEPDANITGSFLLRSSSEVGGAAMRRREFITLLGGAASWPLAANAQQQERRIGVLTGIAGEDVQTKARVAAFSQEMQKLGWNEGRNLRTDLRAGAGNLATIRKYAAELVGLSPDVILVSGTTPVTVLLEATRKVPVVFTIVIDPMGAGFVNKLSRPGGNATGFMTFDYSLSGKWVELLKQVAPGVTQVAVLRDTSSSAGIGQFAVIQAFARPLGLEVSAINPADPREMDRAVTEFAREPNCGLIVTSAPSTVVHRSLIIDLAARHKLPAVYFDRTPVSEGGLISYGPDLVDQFQEAARYVDRILRGEKPANLPVQAPNKYELVVNLRTAKTLGLAIPPTVLARAGELIE
jgi:putative ABC transport system substrate-binding protein